MISRAGRYLKFLPAALGKRRAMELTYFVTEKCNMNCTHCFNRLKNLKNPQQELSVNEVDRFSRTLGPMLRLLLSGGEAFLRQDLADMCMVFIKNTNLLHLSIPTNGSLPEKIVQDVEKIATFFPATFVEIKISLDQLNKKRDALTRHPGGFDKMVESVRRLKQLQKSHKNIGLGVITTCVPENQDELEKIYTFARNVLQVEHYSFGLAREFGDYHPNLDVRRFFEFYLKIFNKNNSWPVMKIPFYNIVKKIMLYRTYLDMIYRNGEAEYIPCLSGSVRAVLDPYGNVYSCEIKGYPYCSSSESSWMMGNLRDYRYNFQKLWHSERAKEIRKRIRNTRCTCNHGCDMDINILFNLRALLKALTLPANKMRSYIEAKNNERGKGI